MTAMILLIVASGIIVGRFVLSPTQIALVAKTGPLALAALLFSIGFELAADRSIWRRMRNFGWRVLLVPAVGAAGSLIGAIVAAPLIGLGIWESLSVGAGFGWYSLSGVLLNNLGYSTLGAIAFLSNVLRELLAVASIPWLAQRIDPIVAIAPGGATTMDTTLALLARYGTHESTLVALVNGAVLSMLVPFLVPLFAKLI